MNSGMYEPDIVKRDSGSRESGERGKDDRTAVVLGTGDHGNDAVDTVSRYSQYGDHAGEIAALVEKEPALGVAIHRDLPYTWAEVEWICRNEMVVHLEDLMARRLRMLFLNARVSIEVAGEVAERIAPVLGWSSDRKKAEIKDFMILSKNYMLYH
jgi:glycerol-3-phosphate dehydrogenase